MNFAGIDPDLHTSAFVVIDENDKIITVAATTIARTLKEEQAIIEMAKTIGRRLGDPWPRTGDFRMVAVESQEISYTARSGKNPRSILNLAPVTGMWLASAATWCPGVILQTPKPQRWKGSVPKQIHQARTLSAFNLSYTKVGADPSTGYCVPNPGQNSIIDNATAVLGKSAWKHLADALGLARWAKQEYLDHLRRNPFPHP